MKTTLNCLAENVIDLIELEDILQHTETNLENTGYDKKALN